MMDLSKMEGVFELCPICGAGREPEEKQPQSGTHAFTMIHKCGTEVDYPIGQIGASFGATCDGKVKRIDYSKMQAERGFLEL